jgi:hypothetical protein
MHRSGMNAAENKDGGMANPQDASSKPRKKTLWRKIAQCWGAITHGIFPSHGSLWDPTQTALDEQGRELAVDAIDGRPAGEWRSRYPKRVHRRIGAEALYLIGTGVLMIAITVLGWLSTHDLCIFSEASCRYERVLSKGVLIFGAGGLGGTLFGLKWLYHSTAKGMWHLDRRPWRLFTPWISGILAVAALALIRSNVITLLNPESIGLPSGLLGVGFLVGYFSDITIGKLNEVALVLFGTQSDRSRRQRNAEGVLEGQRGTVDQSGSDGEDGSSTGTPSNEEGAT